MKKKYVSFIMVFVLMLAMLPISGYATSGVIIKEETITYDDGSTLTITVFESPARSTNTKSGSSVCIKHDTNGNELWRCVLNATFTYDGTTSKATTASSTFTTSSSNWYKDTLYTYRAGNTAYADLTVGQKFLGITVDTVRYTITLTCDKDGNLS